MKKVLYIGRFVLPDKNAAAHRVIGVAKALASLGYETIFVNCVEGLTGSTERNYFGFRTLEVPKPGETDFSITAASALKMIGNIRPDAVIAYNYPSVALTRILRYCRRRDIRCVSDVTEWYNGYGNIVKKTVLHLDSSNRMKRVLYRMDGIIAISRFLYDTYSPKVKTVMIPPVVDAEDGKWHTDAPRTDAKTRFVYAGSVSADKERLDLIVKAISELPKDTDAELRIVGIGEADYRRMYASDEPLDSRIVFLGRISHTDVIREVKAADWSILIRDECRLVKAGFPTKLVESISCGTPVIANRFSNITDYLNDSNSILTDIGHLPEAIRAAASRQFRVQDVRLFDYRRFTDELGKLFVPVKDSVNRP